MTQQSYKEGLRKRKGTDADQLHRAAYRTLARPRQRPPSTVRSAGLAAVQRIEHPGSDVATPHA